MAEGKIVRRGVQPELPTYIVATGATESYNVTFTQNSYWQPGGNSLLSTTDINRTNKIAIVNNSVIIGNIQYVTWINFYDSSDNFITTYGTNDGNPQAGGTIASNHTNGVLNVPSNAAYIALVSDARDSGWSPDQISFANFQTIIVGYDTTASTYSAGGKTYKVHTFETSGTFTVSSLSNDPLKNEVDYLIIAGGGGSAGGRSAGGGAGGYRTTNGTSGGGSSAENKVAVTAQSYTITVGAGGSAGASGQKGNLGNNSSFNSIISIGGGGSGAIFSGQQDGLNGGSGGGGAVFSGPGIGGLGTTNQGFNGGNGQDSGTTGGPRFGGGGGAGEAGENGIALTNTGRGGNGLSNTLRTGSAETRAGGGGGGTNYAAPGGSGGGGNGTTVSGVSNPGQANTGGGGGGTVDVGANGGSGIVIIRYEIAGA